MPRFHRPRSLVHTARRAAAVLLTVTALVLALRPAPEPARAPASDVAPVVVSATDLLPGTVLGAGDLAVTHLPTASVPAGAVPDPEMLLGRVLAGGVRAGEPLTDARLVGAGLTALLPEGQVASPVRLSDLAVTALVRTGDRVNVLATPPDAASAELVAEAALVLAAPGAAAGPEPDPAAGLLLIAVDGPTAARLAAASSTATLTVSLPPP
jgi:Flp pilus assembly protein CpaB